MLNIGIIDCGNWNKKVLNEIVSKKTNLSQKIIEESCKTTKKLENFYICKK